jgi:shikimate kinase
MRVLLIGPMGAGKTTLGNLVSQEFNLPYIDNDLGLSQLNHMSLDQISQLPIPELHALEISYLKNVLEKSGPFIAGVAASVVDYPEGLDLLQRATTIYLRIPLEKILERAGKSGVGRQALQEDAEKVATERFHRRDPRYRAAADLTVELGTSPEEDSEKIISYLRTQQ